MEKNFYPNQYSHFLFVLAFIFCILPVFHASAQHTCGSDGVNARMWQEHPALKQLHDQMETRIHAEMNEHLERKRRDPNYVPASSRMVTTIPVVFHVMHNIGDALGSGSNISLTRIQDEIDSLNACFRNTFGYAGGPDHSNAGISSADVMIEFCLATQDPLGFPTSGVTRHPFSGGSPLYSDNPGMDFGSTADRDMKHIDNWPTDQYFNIWVVDQICDVTGGSCGTAGYAFFPSAHGQYYDGAVVEDQLVGTSGNNTKVLAHEVGHYLGLYHTFEGGCTNGDCTMDGDRICDTPPENHFSNSPTPFINCGGTPNTENTCSTDGDDMSANNPFAGTDVEDIYEAYMDYGFQSCQNTWTPLQGVRMNSALTTERASLHTANVSCATASVTDTRVAFSSAARTVAELDQTATGDCRGDQRDIYVRVQMSMDPGSNVTLNFTTSGTATEGIDFTLLTPTATFTTGGDLYAYAQVRIYNDKAVEGDETLILGYTITGAAMAGASQQTMALTIKDDDVTPTGPGNFIYFQDFEGGSLGVAGWSGSCFCGGVSSNSVNAWTVGTNGGIGSGSNNSAYVSIDPSTQAYGYNNAGGAQNTIAITPFINATSFSDMTMSFDYRANGLAGDDVGLIYYRFGSGDPFTQLSSAGSFVGVSSTTNFSMTLPSNFNNTSFQLGFLWTNDLDGAGANPPFTIDNFGISTPATDVEEDVNNGIPAQDDEQYLGPMSTVYFYDQVSGDLMVKIENTSSHDFGCTTVSVDRSQASAGSNTVAYWNNTSANYLHAKTFLVTPTNNLIGQSYNITLYYTQSEINNYLAATGKTVGDIKVVKYSGQISSVAPPANGTEVTDSEIINYNGSLATPNFGTTAYGIEATSSSGFSGFGIGDPGSPFGVELLSFTGKAQGDQVALEWLTERESNNDYFLLERSMDRSLFSPLAKVTGNGTTTSKSVYNYLDEFPLSGTNYYRLKQVDFDGSFEYSHLVEVSFNPQGVHRVYPNPFDETLTVKLYAQKAGTAHLSLYSAVGKKVTHKVWKYDSQGTVSIPVRHLPSGVYIYELKDGISIQRGKLVK